jgi:hypothetical protein
MITFVPGFASQRVADWNARLDSVRRAAGTDADAQFRAVAAFRQGSRCRVPCSRMWPIISIT